VPIERWDVLFAIKNQIVHVYLKQLFKGKAPEGINCALPIKWLQCTECSEVEEEVEEEGEVEELDERDYDYPSEPGTRPISKNIQEPSPIWFKSISSCVPNELVETMLSEINVRITGISLVFNNFLSSPYPVYTLKSDKGRMRLKASKDQTMWIIKFNRTVVASRRIAEDEVCPFRNNLWDVFEF